MYSPSLYIPGVNIGAVEEEPRLLPRFVMLLGAVVVAVWVVKPLGLLFCLGLALYAMFGPRQTVEALSLLAFMIIFGKADTGLVRWVVLFAAFGRTLWDSIFLDAPHPRILVPILTFAVTIILFSVLASYFPVISVFKVFSWTVGLFTTFTALYRTMHLRNYWMQWFFSIGVFILLASLPLYGSGLGYSRGAGFQGILSHPQTFGPIAAPITALLTGLFLFHGNRSILVVLGMAAGWFGMYASQSRTALLGLVLSLFVSVAAAMLRGPAWQERVAHIFSRLGTWVAVIILVVAAAFYLPVIKGTVMGFLMKDEAASSVAASLEDSRGDLIGRSMDNFRSAPITGIGFGVPSYPEFFRPEYGFMGLPLSASVEKGFMPSAVLEETGLVGAILVIILLIWMIWPVFRHGDIAIFWMLLACVMMNLGEMIFFSIGGMGFFFWILMAFCHIYSVASSPRFQLVESYYP